MPHYLIFDNPPSLIQCLASTTTYDEGSIPDSINWQSISINQDTFSRDGTPYDDSQIGIKVQEGSEPEISMEEKGLDEISEFVELDGSIVEESYQSDVSVEADVDEEMYAESQAQTQFTVHTGNRRGTTQPQPTQPSMFLHNSEGEEEISFAQTQVTVSEVSPEFNFDPNKLTPLNEARAILRKHNGYGRPKINILAVILFVGDEKQFISKTGLPGTSQSYTLMDSSTGSLNLVLWGDQAGVLKEFQRGDIISISKMELSTFQNVIQGGIKNVSECEICFRNFPISAEDTRYVYSDMWEEVIESAAKVFELVRWYQNYLAAMNQ